MTFDVYNKEPNEKIINREKELIKAAFSSPQGRELLDIWKSRLVYSPVWSQAEAEAVCRHKAGRHSVYRDLITLAEGK